MDGYRWSDLNISDLPFPLLGKEALNCSWKDLLSTIGHLKKLREVILQGLLGKVALQRCG